MAFERELFYRNQPVNYIFYKKGIPFEIPSNQIFSLLLYNTVSITFP